MPERLTPCGPEDCCGYVCVFHSLSSEVQGELLRRQARIEELESAAADALSDLQWVERIGGGDNFQASILKLISALAAGEECTCEWKYDAIDDMWETSCGQAWTFIDGGPKDNHVTFCHNCGAKVAALAAGSENPKGDEDG